MLSNTLLNLYKICIHRSHLFPFAMLLFPPPNTFLLLFHKMAKRFALQELSAVKSELVTVHSYLKK